MSFAMRNTHYRSSDGQRDYVFDFEYVGPGWRVYIRSPCEMRGASAVALHILGHPSRPYVCWDSTIRTLDDAKAVAALWADAMQAYYTTGTFAPPGDRSNVRDLSSSAQWPLRSHAGDPQGRTPATAAPRPPQRRRWFWNRERNN